MKPGNNTPDESPNDEFIRELTRIDESVADGVRVAAGGVSETKGPLSSTSFGSEPLSVELESAADCLLLINRVRNMHPEALADLAGDNSQSLWLDGGVEHPSRIGRFEIKHQLGQGGFGIVFLAHDPELDREIALKVPRIEALITEQTRQRFLREGKAAASLNHANIAAVYEAGRIGPICYIASARCKGGSLAQLLKCRGENGGAATPASPDDFKAIAKLIATLADAVQHAHNRGILHRDLKPGNILFEQAVDGFSDELSAQARIVDFGLARTIESSEEHTRTGATIGTPAYMSPEQATGQRDETGPPTDVYSLGAILYELICGQPPFKEASDIDTLVAVRTQLVQPPAKHNASIPGDLAAIAMHCLEKSPTKRYANASQFADDLQRYLEGRSISVRPITRREQLTRWCRRNPLIAGLLSVVAVLLTCLIIGTTSAAIMLDRSKEEVAEARQEAQNNLASAAAAEQRATEHEQLASRALYQARMVQAESMIQSREVGRRVTSLEAIAAATRHATESKLDEAEKLKLRNLAIGAMSLVDLKQDKVYQFRSWPDRDADQYVHSPRDGELIVRRAADDQIVATISDATVEHELRQVLFSPDGQYLAATFGVERLAYLRVWRWMDGALVYSSKLPDWRSCQFDFCSDGRAIVTQPDNSLVLLSPEDFKPLRTITSSAPTYTIRMHQGSNMLAAHRGSKIDLIDIETGEVVRSIGGVPKAWEIDWSSDGHQVAAATGPNGVLVWDARTGRQVRHLTSARKLVGLDLHPTLRLAVTRSYDGNAKVWDLSTESVVVTANGASRGFSGDGKWLCLHNGRWEIAPAREHASVEQPLAKTVPKTKAETLGFLEGGRILAASDEHQMVFWDLERLQPLAVWRTRWCTLDPTGQFVVGQREGKLTRWRIKRNETDDAITFTIAGPEPTKGVGPEYQSFSSDGRLLAFTRRYHAPFGAGTHDFTSGRNQALSPQHSGVKWIDVSNDGKLVATGTWHGNDVMLWDATKGTRTASIDCGSARVRFSPDGSQLAIDAHERYTVVDSKSVEPIIPWTARSSSRTPGPIAFSPDGQVLAVTDSTSSIKLVRIQSNTEVCQLNADPDDNITSIAFTPDGSKLVTGTEHGTRRIHVWDLARIGGWLRSNQLGWSLASSEATGALHGKSIRVELP